jgi:hypothetical protein
VIPSWAVQIITTAAEVGVDVSLPPSINPSIVRLFLTSPQTQLELRVFSLGTSTCLINSNFSSDFSRNPSTMAPRHCDQPCFVCPHPDLLAKVNNQALHVQGAANVQAAKQAINFVGAKRNLPGLNDGTIFPKSHYSRPTSIMEMSTAALARESLRGTIRWIVPSKSIGFVS